MSDDTSKNTEETREVTKEIKVLFAEADAAADCSDSAVKRTFFTKRAIKFRVIAKEKERKAWSLVRELYPETTSRDMTYKIGTGKVHLDPAE